MHLEFIFSFRIFQFNFSRLFIYVWWLIFSLSKTFIATLSSNGEKSGILWVIHLEGMSWPLKCWSDDDWIIFFWFLFHLLLMKFAWNLNVFDLFDSFWWFSSSPSSSSSSWSLIASHKSSYKNSSSACEKMF